MSRTSRPGSNSLTENPATFADHAASAAAFFGVPWDGPGASFL